MLLTMLIAVIGLVLSSLALDRIKQYKIKVDFELKFIKRRLANLELPIETETVYQRLTIDPEAANAIADMTIECEVHKSAARLRWDKVLRMKSAKYCGVTSHTTHVCSECQVCITAGMGRVYVKRKGSRHLAKMVICTGCWVTNVGAVDDIK